MPNPPAKSFDKKENMVPKPAKDTKPLARQALKQINVGKIVQNEKQNGEIKPDDMKKVLKSVQHKEVDAAGLSNDAELSSGNENKKIKAEKMVNNKKKIEEKGAKNGKKVTFTADVAAESSKGPKSFSAKYKPTKVENIVKKDEKKIENGKMVTKSTVDQDAVPLPNVDGFNVLSLIHSGKFAKVFLATEKGDKKKKVAIKLMAQSDVANIDQLRREVGIHSHLDHPNILKFYEFIVDEVDAMLVLEYAPYGTLRQELNSQPNKRFSEERTAGYILSLTNALFYLHERKVIHRDLSLDHILLDKNDRLKVANFGSSVLLSHAKRRTICGAYDYQAPEMVDKVPYDENVDLWSLGVLCYEMLVGKLPEPKPVRDREYKVPTFVSKDAAKFVLKLLKPNPSDRLTLEEIRKQPFFVENVIKIASNYY